MNGQPSASEVSLPTAVPRRRPWADESDEDSEAPATKPKAPARLVADEAPLPTACVGTVKNKTRRERQRGQQGTVVRGNGGSHGGTYLPAPDESACLQQSCVAEQAPTTTAPRLNSRQRRVIGDILEIDTGGQLHDDLRQFTLGELSLDNYLARLDVHIQILHRIFQQVESYAGSEVVRQMEDLRRLLAL